MKKNLDYYLNLPYSYSIQWSDTDQCYLGSISELEQNMTCGNTPEETMSNLKEALEAYIRTSLDNNFDIPEPVSVNDFKGKISYRTSKTTHYYIFMLARNLGMSINAFIDEAVNEKINKKQFTY